ncbi:MAG: VacB/RNase II family 3'-5' exoribonuclease [Phycisphaeraceae bacterium]|nr:VacB/RNase II family 3'-5' exoribonuclease [Phycisphaeraceae bacterium]MBX3366979.1 VacB/RNase II family 3'-5' exoribonuclease [Phycisphaeraceae bacterium]
MTLRYEGRLKQHLSHETYTPQTIAELAADLRVEDPADFEQAIKQLSRDGVVVVSATGRVSLPSLSSSGGEITGIFKGNPKGFGFVRPEDSYKEGDVFIPPDATGGALSGDRVRVLVARERRRGDEQGFVGEVVEILKRKRAAFTGNIFKQGQQWLVQPDGREMNKPIVVRDAASKNVKPGDKVVVEIVEYPEGDALAEGVISRVLGEAGRPDVETQAVIAAFALPDLEFPEACMQQARDAAARFDEEIADYVKHGEKALKGRRDLTGEYIITIDPPDAKDYDDAISIKRTAEGWELGVHIADVAHFIEPGSPLDVEAADRGNSVYLPRLVIPMLPEILSNGICSLQEGVHRYCKSAFMVYDKHGNVKREGAGSVLIKSAKRLTYLEAQALIDGDEVEAKKHAKTEPIYTEQLISTLKEMDALARAIQGKRHRNGMISLELPDVVLIYDENGRVIDAEREDSAYTHTLIEMFMVEANEVLARLFEGLQVPLLRRVHPEPTPGNTEDLRKTATVAGFKIPKNPTRKELQGLLDATRGTSAARAVHMAVLRTLTKAEYSPALIGHFALASSAYAHFTSPIRRYPDLTVHRALAEYLRLTDNARNKPQSDNEKIELGKRMMSSPMCPHVQDLMEIGRHCTQKEVNAEDAEKQLRGFLVMQLLADHVGESYAGVVTGVSPRGVFVQLDKYLADGMIKTSDLPGDVTRSNAQPNWRIDSRTGALVDINSGRSFNMGDTVHVTIAAVDLAQRRMDLLITDGASRAAGKAKVPTLKLGQTGGGIGKAAGAGFDKFGGKTGSQRRSQKSKQRDKGKNHRRDK